MPDPVTVGTASAVGLGTSLAANRLTDPELAALLRDIHNELVIANRYSKAQRERTLYPIRIGPGVTYRATEQQRMEKLLSSGAPGDEIGLMQGVSALFTWVNVSGDPIMIDVPILLLGDISVVNISDPADVTYRATLFTRRDTGIGMVR